MLTDLYQRGNYQAVISAADIQQINAQSAPIEAMLVAASHLQLGHLDIALRLCRELEPVIGTKIDFQQLFASCLRRNGLLDESEKIYRSALDAEPSNRILLNNYANLLIDLDKLDQAEQILSAVIEADISYEDAIHNMDRLRRKRQESSKLEIKSRGRSESKIHLRTDSKYIDLDSRQAAGNGFLDPLAMAFSTEEVIEDRKQRQSKEKAVPTQPIPFFPAMEKAELYDELVAAARQSIVDGCPTIALELINELMNDSENGFHCDIYNIIADAYIALQHYEAAELALMICLELNGEDANTLINLTSLACARQDVHLAKLRYARCVHFGIAETNQEALKCQIQILEDNNKRPMARECGFYDKTKDIQQK